MDDFSCLVFDIKEIKKDDFCPSLIDILSVIASKIVEGDLPFVIYFLL